MGMRDFTIRITFVFCMIQHSLKELTKIDGRETPPNSRLPKHSFEVAEAPVYMTNVTLLEL
jgi:hypothetical protein